MNRMLLAVALFLSFHATGFAEELPNGKSPELKSDKDHVSYGIGLRIGNQLKSDWLLIDPQVLAQGIKDALAGKKPPVDDKQFESAMKNFQKEMGQKRDVAMAAAAEKNKRDGEAFLAVNKKKKGVTTLASGLQYEVIKSGKGASPKMTDTVKTHYHGTLLDGTVFDSSVERNMPATFGVGQVIAGWTEALQLMKVGDKWRLFVPSNLAYAARGAGDDIGPHATLIFEVELLEIQD